ncbi:amino acid adenylation domain-containing protein [Xylariaceae sp. FL1019]|nr:amino acid adenylation domain-containing protein [Xylariaceae sp. FL1019]
MATVQLVELAPGFKAYASVDPALQQSEEEPRFIYSEIFIDHCYDVAPLPDDAFIVDAGGNIGLFSLYMKSKYPQSRILAVEPAPTNFDMMTKNLELHGAAQGVETHQCALGSTDGEGELTFYPNLPGNSTLVPDIRNKQRSFMARMVGAEKVEKLYGGAQAINVPIKRLSHLLKDCEGLSKIDLLKIDVEGVELEVLEGIDDEHWAMVANVALELNKSGGKLESIEALLRSKGFEVETQATEWSSNFKALLKSKGFDVSKAQAPAPQGVMVVARRQSN